jgi:acetyl-CoA synthetase
MADIPEPIPIHPVAPRLKGAHKKPHVGPHIDAYKVAHSETIGHESDKWWAKVRLHF